MRSLLQATSFYSICAFIRCLEQDINLFIVKADMQSITQFFWGKQVRRCIESVCFSGITTVFTVKIGFVDFFILFFHIMGIGGNDNRHVHFFVQSPQCFVYRNLFFVVFQARLTLKKEIAFTKNLNAPVDESFSLIKIAIKNKMGQIATKAST